MKIDIEKLRKSIEENNPTCENYSLFFDSMANDILSYIEYNDETEEEYEHDLLLDILTDAYRIDLRDMLNDYELNERENP